MPHNWVLVEPGSLQIVGELGNQLIANPEAFARQYIPESDKVIAHTDIVPPGEKQTIYFSRPASRAGIRSYAPFRDTGWS